MNIKKKALEIIENTAKKIPAVNRMLEKDLLFLDDKWKQYELFAYKYWEYL